MGKLPKMMIAIALGVTIGIVMVFFVFPYSMAESQARIHKAVDLLPEVEEANFCSVAADCEFVGHCRPMASYTQQEGIIVNKNEAYKIKEMFGDLDIDFCEAYGYLAPKSEDIACDDHIGHVNFTRDKCIDTRFV